MARHRDNAGGWPAASWKCIWHPVKNDRRMDRPMCPDIESCLCKIGTACACLTNMVILYLTGYASARIQGKLRVVGIGVTCLALVAFGTPVLEKCYPGKDPRNALTFLRCVSGGCKGWEEDLGSSKTFPGRGRATKWA